MSELVVNVLEFGAWPDGGKTDNAPAIQAAIDEAGARARQTGRTVQVRVPGAARAYYVFDTLWVDHPHVELVGDGMNASVVSMYGAVKKNTIMIGLRRRDSIGGTPIEIDASHRPDCFGKLDAVACPASGRMWGLDTRNRAWAQFQASPLSHGPDSPTFGREHAGNWAETPRLTLECMIEPPDGGTFAGQRGLLGVGAMFTDPVFVLGTSDTVLGDYWVRYATADGMTREFRFAGHDAMPPYRITLQFDLAGGAIAAFLNGMQIELTNGTPPPPGLPGFRANEFYPFLIGADGPGGTSGGIDATTGISLRLYGLRLSSTIRYCADGPGTPQVRVDDPAAPITDAYRYFGNDAHTIVTLPLDDDPATLTRNIATFHGDQLGNVRGGGVFMSAACSGGVQGNAIRRLGVTGPGAWGIPIAVGGVLDLDLEEVRAGAGFYGIGSWHAFANYTVRGRRLMLGGRDASYYGHDQIATLDDVHIEQAGRTTFRTAASMLNVNQVFIAHADSNNEYVCRFHAGHGGYGGVYTVREMMVDFEGSTLRKAVISCDALPRNGAMLTVDGLYLGTVGPVPIFQLCDGAAHWGRSLVRAAFIGAPAADHSCIVECDGPLWSGTVAGVNYGPNADRPIPALKQCNRFGVNNGIRFEGAPAA